LGHGRDRFDSYKGQPYAATRTRATCLPRCQAARAYGVSWSSRETNPKPMVAKSGLTAAADALRGRYRGLPLRRRMMWAPARLGTAGPCLWRHVGGVDAKPVDEEGPHGADYAVASSGEAPDVCGPRSCRHSPVRKQDTTRLRTRTPGVTVVDAAHDSRKDRPWSPSGLLGRTPGSGHLSSEPCAASWLGLPAGRSVTTTAGSGSRRSCSGSGSSR